MEPRKFFLLQHQHTTSGSAQECRRRAAAGPSANHNRIINTRRHGAIKRQNAKALKRELVGCARNDKQKRPRASSWAFEELRKLLGEDGAQHGILSTVEQLQQAQIEHCRRAFRPIGNLQASIFVRRRGGQDRGVKSKLIFVVWRESAREQSEIHVILVSFNTDRATRFALQIHVRQVSLHEIIPRGRSVDPHISRSEEHTSELQSRFGISYAVFCLKKK